MHYRFQHRDQVYQVAVDRQGEEYQVTVNGTAGRVEILDSQPGKLSLRVNGSPVTVYWAGQGSDKWPSLNGCTYRLEKPSPRHARGSGDPSSGEAVRAPMPAQVRAVDVHEGDEVEKGQTLLLLEAMKMEIRIKAPRRGRLRRLPVKAGQTVDKDDLLAEIGE
jgi:biotin carboxyl carrier protein